MADNPVGPPRLDPAELKRRQVEGGKKGAETKRLIKMGTIQRSSDQAKELLKDRWRQLKELMKLLAIDHDISGVATLRTLGTPEASQIHFRSTLNV
eukprot:198503_1